MPICVYCERSHLEIAELLDRVGVCLPSKETLLCLGNPARYYCRDCAPEHLVHQQINATLELPHDTRELFHHCPMLEYDGYPPNEASFIIELREAGDHYEGNCPECGLQLRSKRSNHLQQRDE